MRPLSDSRRVPSPAGRPLIILLLAFAIALSLVAACGEATAEVEPNTSVGSTTSQVTTPSAEVTTTLGVSTTATTPTTTPTTASVPDAQLEAAAAVGDIAAGEDLFFEALDGIHDSAACATCHSFDPNNSLWAPSLAGVWVVAGGRVEGLTDVEYLRQSIVDPGAFVVEGSWRFAMPVRYPDLLSDDQINNLIAFLLTR